MFKPHNSMVSLAMVLFAASAGAGPLMYTVTVSGQFGTVDAATGAFNQIGPTLADPLGGLVATPSGYLGVSFSGNLDAVNPATGAPSVIGATGLGSSALDTAYLNGTIYETDFSGNLYTISATTGASSLIGYTGIPPAPSDPAVQCDEAFFSAGGNLYATFDAFNSTTLAVVIAPELYQINPITGVATPLGPTSLHLNAALDVSGVVYAFQGQPSTFTDDVLSLSLPSGNTMFISSVTASATPVDGAAATPEPATIALAGAGIAAIALARRWRVGS
jgi:hypothetical protein